MKLLICLPGSNFSGVFLDSFLNFNSWCLRRGIETIISRQESCNIYYVRNMCAGGQVLSGKHQKPWQGQIDYDYMLWIDSDVIFNPEDFASLLSMDKDIASGVYLMSEKGGHPQRFATVKKWDEEYFLKNSSFEFLTKEDVRKSDTPFVADYTGFGFILIKKGVFEKLEYPWFRPIFFDFGEVRDFCMEDVGFCLHAKSNGFKVWINPQTIVKHEKKILLS